ncbi:MAG: hypothetical protein RLZZ340_71, partial [Actinomycetota bacterium]
AAVSIFMVEAVEAGVPAFRSKSTSSVAALITAALKVPSLGSAASMATEQVRAIEEVTEGVGLALWLALSLGWLTAVLEAPEMLKPAIISASVATPDAEPIAICLK